MNLLGHVGLSLAIAYSADSLILKAPLNNGNSLHNYHFERFAKWFNKNIDYRVVIISSIAADLIDKPLGLWLIPDFVSYNTRSVGHSLLFCLALFLLCVFFRKTWRQNMVIVAAMNISHLIFDQMWMQREISLWPLYGWEFPIIDSTTFSNYSENVINNLYNFYKYPWEVIGMIIIAMFIIRMIFKGNIISFLQHGKID